MADVIVSLVHDGLGIGVDDAGTLGWQDRALCARSIQRPSSLRRGAATRRPRGYAAAARSGGCLEYALEHDERFGIWGGLSERERRRLKREAV